MSRTELVRIRLAVQLLLDRRLLLFGVTDAIFLFAGVMAAMGGSGYAGDFWHWLFLVPSLVLGVPMLAEAVALERRSGTLDLALSSPGAEWYFERRVFGAAALLVVQGWIAVVATRILFVNEQFSVAGPSVRVLTVTLFIATAVLNWAVRLQTPGAVVFATYLTAIAFAPWFFANPIELASPMSQLPTAEIVIRSVKDNCVLIGASVVFYLYALQRLRNPELLLS